MNLSRPLFTILALLAACLGPAPCLAVKILTPLDKTLTDQDSILVLGSAPKGSEVSWSVKGPSRSDRGTSRADLGEAFEIFVLLEPGNNRIQVENATLEVFRQSAGQPAPKDYRPQLLHAGDISRCEDCHVSGSARLLDGGMPQVCLACHVVESQNPKNDLDPRKWPHFQTVISNCTSCHLSHAAKNKKFLRKETSALCGACHSSQTAGAAGHPAYDEGGCAACHDAHYSGYENELIEPLPAVCHKCHTQGAGIEASKAHQPLGKPASCAECHAPHGTTPKLLKQDGAKVCNACHAAVLTHGHKGELSECGACHDPHLAKGSRLLKADYAAKCQECHDEVVKGKTVHTAVKKGCQSCHSPHNDQNLADAKKSCARCHDVTKDKELASIHGGLSLPVETCLGCHPAHSSPEDKLLRGKVHFPLTQGKCTACHGGGEQPGFKVKDAASRCSSCHDTIAKMKSRGETLHDPVGSGECTVCHDPHMARQRSLLTKPQAEACRECHDSVPAAGDKGRQLHPPAETCTDCHGPHGGPNPKFLAAKGADLCAQCHDDPRKAGGALHAALDDGCTACHDPHAGFSAKYLKKEPAKALCLDCHEDPGAGKKVSHAALDDGCLSCHGPHGSKNRKLLRKAEALTCRECHDAVASGDGKGRELHPPAETCTECHGAHGGDGPKLLPAQGADLCLKCHEDPRKGEGELHPALDEGCSACHDAHAGFSPGFLRGDTPKAACLACHDDPAAGKKKPHAALAKGCQTCHAPHRSVVPTFLKRAGNSLCQPCHAKLSDRHKAAPPSPGDGKEAKAGEAPCTSCHNPHASDK